MRAIGYRAGLAVLSGGLLALAFPGSGDQGWLAFGALVPLLLTIEDVSLGRAAVLGLASGVAFWGATIPWIAPTMVRYGGLPWPLAILILLALVGYLALYWLAFAVLLTGLGGFSRAIYVIAGASTWVALELLRTFLFTGFPWNLLGYSQYQDPLIRQIAAVTGVYGVSFVVMAVNLALAGAVREWKARTEVIWAAGTGGVILMTAIAYGWFAPAAQAETGLIPVAVVQGNVEQAVKWDPAWQGRTLDTYARLTREASGPVGLVVWPETAAPLFFQEDERRAEMQALARETGAYLLFGALGQAHGRPTNSAFLLGPDGALQGRYDKRHLVPFGEYVPLRNLLFFVNVLAGGSIGEFAPGKAVTVFPTPVGRIGVVICYEAIFPGEVRQFVRDGATLLVNITNDAWFGRSAAPAQHFAMAVFRAIETRTYLIRAANTGISGIVAPDGRVLQVTGLSTPAVLSASVRARAETSLYARYGDVFAWGTVAVALYALLAKLSVWALRSLAARRAAAPGTCAPVIHRRASRGDGP